MGEAVAGLASWEAAAIAVEAVKRLLGILNLPTDLSAYGIPKSDLLKLVEGGMKQARLFIPNPRDLTGKDVESINAGAF
jgi:alcohol dehydrogenase class IV